MGLVGWYPSVTASENVKVDISIEDEDEDASESALGVKLGWVRFWNRLRL